MINKYDNQMYDYYIFYCRDQVLYTEEYSYDQFLADMEKEKISSDILKERDEMMRKGGGI